MSSRLLFCTLGASAGGRTCILGSGAGVGVDAGLGVCLVLGVGADSVVGL